MPLNFTFPFGYQENTLILMVQCPHVLYVYWELSPNQRAAFDENVKLQLRLNIVDGGPYRAYEIKSFWDSFYFTGVEPDREYYCDICILDTGGNSYPLIYSNKIFTPVEGPSSGHKTVSSDFWGKGNPEDKWHGISSGAFY